MRWLVVLLAGCASPAVSPGPPDFAVPTGSDLATTSDLGGDAAMGTGPILLTTSFGAVVAPLAFVAGQDADGAWVKLNSTDGHYQLPVTTGRYGLFWVCPPTQSTDLAGLSTKGGPVWVAATRAELPILTAYCPAQQGTAIYNGLAANAPAVELCAGAECNVTQQKSFTQTVAFNPPIGPVDLFAGRVGSGNKLNDVRVSRDATISTSPGSPTNLDTSTGFSALVSNNLTSNAVGTDTLSIHTSWRLRNGLDVALAIGSPPSILAAPLTALATEEVQWLSVNAMSSTASDSLRIVDRYFRAPAAIDAQLPSIFAAVTASSVASGSEHVIKFAFTPAPGAQGYFGGMRQGGADVAIYRMFISPGWLGSNTSVTAPAIGGMPGFPVVYLWTQSAAWQFGAITSTKNFVDLLNVVGPPAAALDGYTRTFSLRSGSLPP